MTFHASIICNNSTVQQSSSPADSLAVAMKFVGTTMAMAAPFGALINTITKQQSKRQRQWQTMTVNAEAGGDTPGELCGYLPWVLTPDCWHAGKATIRIHICYGRGDE
ncbi:unnamed protein product [Ceratitis capitata]|uniref:(Mediterranean fruit fly) hypothetical protein n=1 Tax=Ceratitis capitata TaxID=7213 RepID=A0A811V407_CERCA|nr:unnamed protein product [Ceratitis capitata]